MDYKPIDAVSRCPWCGGDDLLHLQYHDEEWGVPVHDDAALFEKLILDGAQAGLSWITILRKREGYRRAFEGFDAAKIARYGEQDVARLMSDAGIVRNRLKINATIQNAKSYLALKENGESFDQFLWQFVDNKTMQHHIESVDQIPTQSPESVAMSEALRQLGFKFVGPTICYAFMQAVGMINDHLITCFRYEQLVGSG